MSHRNSRDKTARPSLLILLALALTLPFGSTSSASTSGASILPKPLTFRNLSTKDGLSSDMILSLAVRGDQVWFGTYAGGATLFDTVRKTFKAYTTKGEPQDKIDDGQSINWKNRLPYNHVSAIQVDGDQVWFGTYFYGFWGGGISTYRPKSKSPWHKYSTFNRRAKKVVCLAVEPGGVWVGSERGLSYLDRKSGQWAAFYSTQDGLAGNFVNALVDEPDALWVGTNAGVSRLDKARKTWTSFGQAQGLEDLDIKSLARVGASLWAGTSGGRLFVLKDGRDRWESIARPDALPKGTVNALVARSGLVFVCRDDGVDIHDPASGAWEGLTSADGLPSDTILSAASAPEGIWFGTDMGASFLTLPTRK